MGVDIITAIDYYPFGMLMPGRSGSLINGEWTEGGNAVLAHLTVDERSGNQPVEYVATGSIEFLPGFESGDGDAFVAYIDPDATIGSVGEGSGLYRYGFNGKGNDNEVKGEGNQQDYGMRIYDGRLGRFLSVDPITKSYPMLTPYQFASNSPIAAIDIDGLEGEWHMSSESERLKRQGELLIKQLNTESAKPKNQLTALNIPPFSPATLSQGPPPGSWGEKRSAQLKRDYEMNKQMKLRAALDPISYGGPGFGQGMVRDPLVQASASMVAPELGFAMGAYTAYDGYKTGDGGTMAQGGLMMLPILSKFIPSSAPYGFVNSKHFSDVSNQIKNTGVTLADDIQVGLRGSRVSGISSSTGSPVTSASDFDFFIVSDNLYQEGIKLGAKATNGALSVGATRNFPSLIKLEAELSSQLGSKTTFRVFSKKGFENIVKKEGNYLLSK